jgi:hypothetical protein
MAYRLLDLETNVIIESIHVEFIKNKFISDSNVQEPNLKGVVIHFWVPTKN